MTVTTLERPSAALTIGDMAYSTIPPELDGLEAIHYWRGFERAEKAFAKKHGRPGVVHDGRAPRPGTPEHDALGAELAALGRAYREAMRPIAHAAGMRAVAKLWRERGLEHRAGEITDALAPVKAPRKRATVKPKPAAVESVPAPVESAAPVTVETIAAAAPSAEAAATVRAAADSGRLVVLHVGKESPRESEAPAESEPAPEESAAYWAGVRARKALRRELAAAMRARGLEPRGEKWRRECAAAGLPVGGAE